LSDVDTSSVTAQEILVRLITSIICKKKLFVYIAFLLFAKFPFLMIQ
jgi:hypothetical protein